MAPLDTREPELGFSTQQLHGGVGTDGDGFHARATPIYLSAGFVFDDFEQAADRFDGATGSGDGYSYTRTGNPTTASVERRLAVLERGRNALLVGSGQAAASVALLGLLQAGDHVLAASSLYEGSRGLLVENFGRLGIEAGFVDDANDAGAWQAAIRPNTRAVFVESIPNPKNDLVDIELVAGVAHRNGIPLVVDNTFATPYLQRPIEHGADIVIHSASKFLAGHGSVLGGVIVDAGTFDWADASRFPHLNEPSRSLGGLSFVERFGADAYFVYAKDVVAARFGPTPSPLNAFLIQQGVETLSLRVERQSRNALAVARWLEQRPEVHSVDYSGLESSPYHALAERYLPRGQGSVFSFTLRGGVEAARAFFDAVQIFTRMTHLGDVRSLVIHPASTSHAARTEDERRAAGVWPGMLRLSIGIEDEVDLLADVERALRAAAAAIADGSTRAPVTTPEASVPGVAVSAAASTDAGATESGTLSEPAPAALDSIGHVA